MSGLLSLMLVMQIGTSMVAIPAGNFQPLYGLSGDTRTQVRSFRLDRDPVTRAQYVTFVNASPDWRRSAVRGVYAQREQYLVDWDGDLDAGRGAHLRRPVTSVSWFAARAYCAWRGARLPSVAEWEYAASASAARRDAARDAPFVQHVVSLYASRSPVVSVIDSAETNVYDVRGMHDLVSEWVSDFNSVLVSDDSRGVGGHDHDLFCASAAIGATDPTNYAAFLRYALRASLSGRSTLATLGFRCAS